MPETSTRIQTAIDELEVVASKGRSCAPGSPCTPQIGVLAPFLCRYPSFCASVCGV
jgi:hypothetical protein